MRARLSLVMQGHRVCLREVVLKHKPDQLLQVSPKGTVPVLVLPDGRVLDESIDIVRWSISESPDRRAYIDEARVDESESRRWSDAPLDNVLLAYNDFEFKSALDCYKYADRFPQRSMQDYRLECMPFIYTLSQALGSSPYLKGEQLSVTDIVILPFVRQFAHVDLAWFEASAPHNVQQWLGAFLNDPLFLSIMKKYPQWSSESEPVYFP